MNYLLKLIVSIFILSSFQVAANQDSLVRVIRNSKKINCEAYKKLFVLYDKTVPDSVLSLGKHLLNLSIEKRDKNGEALAYQFLGEYYSEKGDHELGLSNLTKAKEYYQYKNAHLETVEIYNAIGNIYYRKGEFAQAATWYRRSFKLGEEDEDIWLSNLAKVNLARAYIQLGKSELGEKLLLEYSQDAERDNKLDELADVYNILGGFYQEQQEYDLSNNYFREALKINLNSGDLRNIAHCYNNLAISYFYQEKNDLAKSYFLKALKIRKQLGVPVAIAESYFNLGDWYYFNEQFDSAKFYYNNSYDVAKNTDDYQSMSDAIYSLEEIAKNEKEYELAFEYYDKYIELKDKQHEKNLNDELDRLEFIDMMTNKKKIQIINDTKQKITTKLNSYFNVQKWIFFSLFILLISIGIYLIYKLKKQKIEVEKHYQMKEDNELENRNKLISIQKSLEEEIELINTSLLKEVKPIPERLKVQFLCKPITKESTRVVELDNKTLFIWDAPLDLAKSIIFWKYLEHNNKDLLDENKIDELLSNQQIVVDFKIEWMIIDNLSSTIVRKSGFKKIEDDKFTTFSAGENIQKSIIVHSSFDEKNLTQLIGLQDSMRELSLFSKDMIASVMEQIKFEELDNLAAIYFL